ncbi:hypothetical protein N7510_000948 [Penicillium lagena]|uniref:uncharacterized protein n=1 Tax=Penicillium lagena TaxID=94218 RepID=UPI002540BB1E|nr:uncharacterized protein N7510_000948 [Penicillium lagena]KAJ5624639.1 hypothetical protein N7510_000948 [Penicillium lagena]
MVTTQIEVTSAVGAIAINGYAMATSTTLSGAESSRNSSVGLSSEAKSAIGAGIGVGTVAVIAIAAATCFFIRGRKAKAKTKQSAELDTSEGPSELYSRNMATELGDKLTAPELDGRENAKSPAELPDNRAPVEME